MGSQRQVAGEQELKERSACATVTGECLLGARNRQAAGRAIARGGKLGMEPIDTSGRCRVPGFEFAHYLTHTGGGNY
jgi:hypothetical protein